MNSEVLEILGNDTVIGVRTNLKTIECDGVFVAIGREATTEMVKDIIKLNEQGFIITDEHMKTSAGNIWAIGDCREKHLRQIVTATSDGAIAAESVMKFLNN